MKKGTKSVRSGTPASQLKNNGNKPSQGLDLGQSPIFADYNAAAAFDEMFTSDRNVRPSWTALAENMAALTAASISDMQAGIERNFMSHGVTFTVYGHEEATEKIIPTDLLPRIIPADDWAVLDKGLKQRLTALNMFLADLYGPQTTLRDGIVPAELVFGSQHFCRAMLDLPVPHGAYVNVCGTDIIRDRQGGFAVLEDNLRVPSGVSYMLSNRDVMRRAFPEAYKALKVRPVDTYPDMLLAMLRSLASDYQPDPVVVVLTPGVHNSAYFEHAYLARLMGTPLVEGRDLLVHDNVVHMRTTQGLKRVDVIYRRVDDAFIDPMSFRRDSILGVPGLMNAYRAGNVVLANAPGTGVADDKAVYAFVPALIRHFLGEDPVIDQIETFLCREASQCQHVLANLDSLVVKAVGESGGYGMLVGPHATKKERADFAEKIKADPSNYIAQPTITLSTAPALIDGVIEPRHVDLRPFLLAGSEMHLTPGALTRVALKRGSLVVNSSQGGGSKDTWVLGDGRTKGARAS